MNAITRTLTRGKRDEGSALIAALGVAMIGIVFSVIAVTIAIQATQDSGRDRTRTTEIHAAESALDVAIMSLQDGLPCTFPDAVVGGGVNAVDVHTTVEYYDEDHNPLTDCVDGEISGTPTQAVITTTGTPHTPGIGIAPSRTITANVNIKPVEVETSGSAIFSGGSFTTGAGFVVDSANPGEEARVWVDSGDWTCNTSITIHGDLVVAQGKVSFQNASCFVTGDVWAKTRFYAAAKKVVGNAIGGDLIVYEPLAGTYGLELSNPQSFGGNVSIGGATGDNLGIHTGTQWTKSTVAGSVCSPNVGGVCGELPNNLPMGFPIIDYTPADFGFGAALPASAFADATATAWGYTSAGWQHDMIYEKPCSPLTWMSTTPISLPVTQTATNTIYNCTEWAWGADSGGAKITLKLYADIVIYAKSFTAPNGVLVISGDSEPHNLYLIVPNAVSGLPSYTPGDIFFTDNALQVNEPIAIFVYTPGSLQFPNSSTTRGQMYGGTVDVRAGGGKFSYFPIPLPNGYLSTASTEDSGYTIEIVSKHEE